MNFTFSDEQAMLADSVSRFIDADYDFDTRQKIAKSETGFSREMWSTFAELGWTAVPFADSDGGLDGGPIELMLMMEQFGRGLVVEPYLANIVLAGGVLRRAANDAQKAEWLAPLIAGDLQAAFAFAEPQGRFDPMNVTTTANAADNKFVLNGTKTYVLNAQDADLLIIPARTSDNQADATGLSLFGVPSSAAGLERTGYASVDALQAAEVNLTNVSIDQDNVLGEINTANETIRSVLDEATLAVSAEAMGIMQTMHDKTVEYTKNRTQFGVPISSFQALQHRMVDTMMTCELTRSLLYWSVMLTAANDPEASRAISALKYQIGTAGVKLGQEAIQMHGGMGMTWEMDISHYFKRLTAISILFGNADHHLDQYIASDSASVA